jgi:hypothetical protein
MKTISYLMAFATKAFSYGETYFESASYPVNHRQYPKRVVLIPFRSPNDQPQLFALPIAYLEEACHPRYSNFNN